MKRYPTSAFEFYQSLLWSIFAWPVWWYSHGLVWAFRQMVDSIVLYARMLNIAVWIKNIFVPMFGQRDWQSRLISIFMRTVQIIGRGIFLLFWTLLMVTLFLLYTVAPIASFGFFFYHFLGF